MRVFGQSQLVDGKPYVHLGYLAATTFKPDGKLLGGGVLLLVVGMLTAFSVVVGRTARGSTSLQFVRRRSRRLLLAGVALLAAGGLATAWAIRTGDYGLAYPEGWTSSQLLHLGAEVEQRLAEGRPVPEQPQQLPALIGWDGLDAWKRPVRIEWRESANRRVLHLSSAGADGDFGTEDDATHEVPPSSSPAGNDPTHDAAPGVE